MHEQDFLTEQIVRHNFTKLVDPFLTQYGTNGIFTDAHNETVRNKILKGSLQIGSDKPLNGYFVYGMDNNGMIYHRYFEKEKLS